MKSFTRLDEIAAPLPLANVDTDKILAARYLKTISRKGLGAALFADLREDPNFILNRTPWTGARILVTLDNFGCGSSREHAPWALADFGISCIIATSIADIFYNNCFKNGILPIILERAEVDALMALAADPATARLRVDLQAQTIAAADGRVFAFEVDAKRRSDLLGGVDDIARSLGHAGAIAAWEERRRAGTPWDKRIDSAALAAL